MGLYIWRIVLRKFLEHKLSQNYGLWEKYDTSSKEKKNMKYWQIGQIVYSHFLIENWKVKTFGTITAHINIEKLNERGKKRLNAKLERHLTRSHILLCEVFAYIYIYIYGLIWPFPSYSKQDFGIAWWRPQTRKSC